MQSLRVRFYVSIGLYTHILQVLTLTMWVAVETNQTSLLLDLVRRERRKGFWCLWRGAGRGEEVSGDWSGVLVVNALEAPEPAT